jgi:hypothetical protein
VIAVSHPAVTNGLTLTYGSAGSYTGLDRFGRVVDQRWQNAAGTTTMDRFRYGYDRASNRLWRENKVAADVTLTRKNLDEFYTYDGLDRLLTADRGDLTGGPPPTGVTSRTFKQNWTLEGLGNWKAFQHDADGDGAYTAAGDLDQTRTHNAVNELTGLAEPADPPGVCRFAGPAGRAAPTVAAATAPPQAGEG